MNAKFLSTLIHTLIPSLLLVGCSSLPNHHLWGANSYQNLTLSYLSRSAERALTDRQTWLPAAGSLLFTLPGVDRKVSDWASRETPIFGSQQNASQYSDDLRWLLLGELVTTALLTPSGDEAGEWLINKAKGASAQLLAGSTAGGMSYQLKLLFKRERPNGADNQSYPSGHATTAFAYSTLANRNLNDLPLSESNRELLQGVNLSLASGVAWARVEAQAHYPSDVLMGAALGHFFSAWINDFLMTEDQGVAIAISKTRMEESVIGLRVDF